MPSADLRTYWALSREAALAALDTSAAGLSTAEANRRRAALGDIQIHDEGRRSGVALFLRQFQSPLVLILVFGGLVAFSLREWADGGIILGIIVISAVLGFVQEYRASAAIAALQRRLALTALVFRNGTETVVPASQIVPGDVVRLSAGNLVPADGLILEAKDFLLTQAALTGESFPVEHKAGSVPASASLVERTNCVFLGSSVQSGTASIVVVRTGRQTEFGLIAAELKGPPPEAEFARGIRHFGYLLLRVMVIVVLAVLTANLVLHRPLVESLLFSVALAVGLSPELLPAIISVTLSSGARNMARRGVIVRHLEAIENLGSIDVLCTDKTGTLTEGVVALDAATDCDGAASPSVRQLAFVNASFETGIENILDAAVIAAGQQAGLSTDGYGKLDEIPYDFRRKRLTIVVSSSGGPEALLITKGAVGTVLSQCTTASFGSRLQMIDELISQRLDAYVHQKSGEGYRVLALATKRLGRKASYGHDDERELCLQGFLLFYDPPKADAVQAIRDLTALGISIKIITGDSRPVAEFVARSVGLDASGTLTGAEIATLKEEALWYRADRATLFVELDPQQKERIVRALQRRGHAVGYLGDGINDAPALHAADVGISVDGAVDVARQAADVILVRRDLDVLRQGVSEGRRTFANTLKYISTTVSANFGNMLTMAVTTPLLPFLPLTATQILLNNFLSDLPAMAISTDNVDQDRIARPQRWSVAQIRRFMILFGAISSVFDGLAFVILLYGFHASEGIFRTAWFLESLLTELVVLLLLRTTRSAFASRPGSLLVFLIVFVGIGALILPYAGPLARLFDFVPLPQNLVFVIAGLVLAYMAVTEVTKRYFFRLSSNA